MINAKVPSAIKGIKQDAFVFLIKHRDSDKSKTKIKKLICEKKSPRRVFEKQC